MQSHRKEREDMEKKTKYYVVREKAVPEVLLKVVEAKRILDSERATTVQEATEQVGISRSSFYKYKDDIFPFHDQAKEEQLPLFCRWMINREYFRIFCAPLLNFEEIS